MSARTANEIHIAAPIDLVWDITNDVATWPRLFSEYAGAEILDAERDYVKFRLTMHPDEQGRVWSWVSERRLDRANRRVSARRVETGPFEYMSIDWSYRGDPAGGTVLTWQQDFALRPDAPLDDPAMAARIDANSQVQLELIRQAVEAAARTPSLRRYVLSGPRLAPLPLADRLGRPLVVVLGNRATQTAGHRLVDELRLDPRTQDVPILQIAHLKGVPASLRPVAEKDIRAGREVQVDRASALRRQAGLPPTDEHDWVGLALDWAGVVGADFGFTARDRELATVVTDPYLCAVRVLRGDEPLEQIAQALHEVATVRLQDRFAALAA